jgi:tRNA(Ile)-lysidine synthase
MILNKVIETVKKYKMINPGEHIVVGVSGGADSVVLLNVLNELKYKWNLTLTVAHLDHMIRGEESRKEAEFVKDIARKMKIPCISDERDVPGYRKAKGLSLQEAAREVRYAFFRDVLNRASANKIALGHHADDQAETVLMWFLRGASLKGLSGIPPLREGVFVRPLIDTTREEIEEYLKNNNIPYVTDSSVSEHHFLRNKIRHQLIPLLKKEYNPRIVKTLTQMADLLRLDSEILDDEVKDLVDKLLVENQNGFCCSIDIIKKYSRSLQGRLIRKIIAKLKGDTKGLGFKHIEAVCHLLDRKGPSKLVQLPGGWCVWRQYDNLVFTREEREKISYYYFFDTLPDSVKIDKIGREIFFRIEKTEGKNRGLSHKERNIEFLNCDELKFPLVIRNWLPGDRFYPLGLGGSKKLKDLFIDSKVPVRERHKVPVILFQDRIAWVCGFRIDDRFKVKSASKQVLKVWIE